MARPFGRFLFVAACLAVFAAASDAVAADPLDESLRKALAQHQITPIEPDPDPRPQLFDLGKALFYDKILSGNKDTSCATCHHDFHKTGDDLSLPLGTGGAGLGPTRLMGASRVFVPRNSPEIFNRGLSLWTSQFWDSRVRKVGDRFINPARGSLPGGFATVLEVQAMFPVTSRDEMRGEIGDDDVFGEHNEIADFNEAEPELVWKALMKRLMAIPGYRELFAAAYPDVASDGFGFQHAAKAIAAYEAKAFRFLDAPWDAYVAGDDAALTPAAKRGAAYFYGKGNCASCHAGNLLTDQQHYNLLIPPLGPGKEYYEPEDLGRFAITGDPLDRHSFRTPPLRNVTVSGPWMHNGCYTSLEAAVRHHGDPIGSFLSYDVNQLFQVALRPTVRHDAKELSVQMPTFSLRALLVPKASDAEMADLLAFLKALESPSLGRLAANKPLTVPSGLPVDGTKLVRAAAATPSPTASKTVP